MSFASLAFFLFLPVVFVLHWIGRSRRWQNTVLVAASYVFYGWWDWRFCFLMLASSLIDYAAGLGLARAHGARSRRTILVLAMTGNLLILGFFKYFNFFVDSLVIALAGLGIELSTTTMHIVLPVGISFYTFQTMSYTLDIYAGKFPPQRNLLDYLAFVSFFPQLVAGPIERATHLLPQFQATRRFSEAEGREGARLMLWGLFKKMVVADNLGTLVDQVYGAPENASGMELAFATFCFAFQIYGDFSAYSDLAVGTALLFGIRLMRNFAYPYFSQSVTEFWRRWHISLSTWFRDYVYVALGGNRGALAQVCRNLFIVALMSGLWHGAGWHFVIWGGLHGLYLAAERVRLPKKPAKSLADVPGEESLLPSAEVLGRMAWTFSLVTFAWIFFRAESVGDAWIICTKISSDLFNPATWTARLPLAQGHLMPLLSLGAMVALEWFGRRQWNPLPVARMPLPLRWTAYTALFWSVLVFGTRRTGEFIYFQF